MKHGYNENGDLKVKKVFAMGENTCAADVPEPSWLETKSFPIDAPIGDVMLWAYGKGITGKLIIAVDESSEIKKDGEK